MKPRVKHLKPSDFRVMPWKNGGGSTTEMAIFPEEATVGGPFLWRLSLAQLAASGPFSTFPGFDRILIQLAGEPMRLRHASANEKALTLFEPYAFSGEWETEGLLNGDGVCDFNVMVDRSRASATAESLFLQETERQKKAQGKVLFLYAWQGTSVVKCPDNVYPLAEGDALLIDDAQANTFTLRGKTSILLLVDIRIVEK